MNFKLTATVETLYKSGVAQKGEWYLYSVKEQTPKFSKTWKMFTNAQLTLGSTYTLEGYITESPNKAFVNSAGKQAYQSTFNVTNFLQVGQSDYQKKSQTEIDNMQEPKFDPNDSIPF